MSRAQYIYRLWGIIGIVLMSTFLIHAYFLRSRHFTKSHLFSREISTVRRLKKNLHNVCTKCVMFASVQMDWWKTYPKKKNLPSLTEITIFLTFNSILPVPKINGISATTILTTSFIIPESWYYNDAFSVTHSAKATYYHYFQHLYGT